MNGIQTRISLDTLAPAIAIAMCALCAPAFVAPATADTYVQFTDGRALEVQGFTLHERAIELDLGKGSRMVLPLSGVEWIEQNGRGIAIAPPTDRSPTTPAKPPQDVATQATADRIDYTEPFADRGASVAIRSDRFRRGRNARSPSP